jgi:hypothetical protein
VQTYILKFLTLRNFDFLDNLCILFNKKFTLISGPNCSGKTSIFNAMQIGDWTSKDLSGQLNLHFKHNSLERKFLDLIYLGDDDLLEESKIFKHSEIYEQYITSNQFFSSFTNFLRSVNFHSYLDLNVHPTLRGLFTDSRLAVGERFVLNLYLIKTLREYIGISGALIMDTSFPSYLSRSQRKLVITVLLSISEQVIIFEGTWSDLSKDLDSSEFDLIYLKSEK